MGCVCNAGKRRKTGSGVPSGRVSTGVIVLTQGSRGMSYASGGQRFAFAHPACCVGPSLAAEETVQPTGLQSRKIIGVLHPGVLKIPRSERLVFRPEKISSVVWYCRAVFISSRPRAYAGVWFSSTIEVIEVRVRKISTKSFQSPDQAANTAATPHIACGKTVLQ